MTEKPDSNQLNTEELLATICSITNASLQELYPEEWQDLIKQLSEEFTITKKS
jgi:hypothetical protein